jgi:5,10-methylenetetrahydromethanopterin reductase
MFGLPWPGPEVARDAEAAGIGAFCTGEFVDLEAYSTLAGMVAGTTTAQVGTGIAYAFARTPYAHAAAIRSLAPQAPGRLFLGLGSGAFRINRDWFGVPADRPVARMSDLVRAVRVWLHAENGKPVQYEGEFYRVDADVRAPVLGRLEVPILVAGFNKGMARAAAAVGDGVIGHGLFTDRWWDEVVRPALDEGARSADRSTPLEHGWVITAVDDEDPDRAVLDARRMIAFYLTVKTYDPLVELHGWEEPVAELRSAFAKGDMTALAAAVTDDMLRAIAVCGRTDDAREQLAARRSLAKDLVYLAPPSFLVSGRRRAVYARNSLSLLS